MEETGHRLSLGHSPGRIPYSSPLSRGVSVLLYVWRNPGSTLADIHRGTSIPKSSLVRIISTLASEHAVLEGADRRYWRGTAFSEPSVDVERVKQIAHTVLVDMAKKYGETVGLFWIDGHSRVCIDAVEGEHEVRRVLVVGQRRPLDVGCTAGAALAFQAMPHLSSRIPQYTEATVTDPQAIRASWKTVREKGYCITHNQTYQGVSGVSAPIFGHGTVPIAVISITGPDYRFRSDEIEEWGNDLVDACDQISQQLASKASSVTGTAGPTRSEV